MRSSNFWITSEIYRKEKYADGVFKKANEEYYMVSRSSIRGL